MSTRRVTTCGRCVVGAIVGLVVCAVQLACGAPPLEPGWQLVARQVPGALLSVAARDGTVFVVGGDPDGDGPASATVLLAAHGGPDVGAPLVPVTIALQGDLWWVHAVSATRAYASGSFGRVVRLDLADTAGLKDGVAPAVTVTPLLTPEPAADADLIVFGVFVSDDEAELFAVGGRAGGTAGGFVWRSVDGRPLESLAVPEVDGVDVAGGGYALWKVAAPRGPAPLSSVWIVGTAGLAYRADGGTLVAHPTGRNTSLFTVDVAGDGGVLAVGGTGRGLALARGASDDAFADVSPAGDATPALAGVHRAGDGRGVAVGAAGAIFDVDGAVLAPAAPLAGVEETLHGAVALDDGARYVVGGRVTGLPLVGGVVVRFVP